MFSHKSDSIKDMTSIKLTTDLQKDPENPNLVRL